MDKSAIRNFAIEARKILMKSAITEAGFYGITKDGCRSPIQKGQDFEVYETLAGTENRIFGSDIKRRTNLVRAIEEQGFEQVIEETAYTWFNRIIAIRFMEVNDYLPTRVRVLSSETGSNTPDIVTQSLDVDLNMTPEELEKVQLAKDNNKYDEAFRLLFIKQCNELNNILPGLFEKTNDYMELLLKLSYTGDGVVRMLVDTVPEDSFNVETEGQVEIIGWMYQYYNTELKDDTFAMLKKNKKLDDTRIASATQLFTPDWIVRYMVENSIGRAWVEHLKHTKKIDEALIAKEFGWKYFLAENESLIDQTYSSLCPQDITCIDPCMGSGHILVYAFDVLMQIYISEGYNERDAAIEIISKNLFGLDIDKRAYQLSYFALMMKARNYNRRVFKELKNRDNVLQIIEIEDSKIINKEHLNYFGQFLTDEKKTSAFNQVNSILTIFSNAKELGSALCIEKYDWDLLEEFVESCAIDKQINLFTVGIEQTQEKLRKLILQAKILHDQYLVVVTNPPYLDPSSMEPKAHKYIKDNYSDSKSDLCSVFVERALTFIQHDGFASLVTMQSWLFLSSYEKMRNKILNKCTVESILHLGMEAFEGIIGKVVTTAAYVITKGLKKENQPLNAIRLVDFYDSRRYMKENEFFNSKNRFACVSQADIKKIPGSPFAYWIDKSWINIFNDNTKLGENAKVKRTLQTGDSNRFMRIWFEVEKDKIELEYLKPEKAISSNATWFMFSYGGKYRKWYGNLELIVNWKNNGQEIKETGKAIIPSENLYFQETLAWSKVTSNDISVRYYDQGILPGDASACVFDYHYNIYTLLGYMNSSIARDILRMISPSMNFPTGTVAQLPIITKLQREDEVVRLVKENIELSREEWNSHETSWGFKEHPILTFRRNTFLQSVEAWKERINFIIKTIACNEKKIDEIFLDELCIDKAILSDVEHGSEAISSITKKEAAKSFIMYAVGCMFGRYSLDKEGIVNAGSTIDIKNYKLFSPDLDNIIPITDELYFEDDIVERFGDFVEKIFEDDADNSLFEIAQCIDEKSTSWRKTIREYFLNCFFQDHISMYSNKNLGKRPIYWLFDSGKENGFKALIYMHRYNHDTIGLMRSDYLNKTQDAIEHALQNTEYIISTSTSAIDKASATKLRDKYIKQLSETRTYYQALSHIALQRIELDLDEGVKANYAKFQGVEVSNEGTKKQTIDLLAKI